MSTSVLLEHGHDADRVRRGQDHGEHDGEFAPVLEFERVLEIGFVDSGSKAETPSPTSMPPAPVPATATSTSTAAVTATATAVPAGTIHVDTLEQEIYPFVENGKCSLGEAIFAANGGEPKDSCAAGAADGSVIELMPGEYHFTQRDQTPPQVEWAFSLSTVGNALPSVLLPLTINGNGAVLIRDEAADPFRFVEVLLGARTLNELTLQGGDVG